MLPCTLCDIPIHLHTSCHVHIYTILHTLSNIDRHRECSIFYLHDTYRSHYSIFARDEALAIRLTIFYVPMKWMWLTHNIITTCTIWTNSLFRNFDENFILFIYTFRYNSKP